MFRPRSSESSHRHKCRSHPLSTSSSPRCIGLTEVGDGNHQVSRIKHRLTMRMLSTVNRRWPLEWALPDFRGSRAICHFSR